MAGDGKSSQHFSNSLTDLMTSLAIIFILLLVVFMKQANEQSRRSKSEIKSQLSEVLEEKQLELSEDPSDPLTLTVKLGERSLRFGFASAKVNSAGQKFVDSLFSKLAWKICRGKVHKKVDSIIIEGHTDRAGEATKAGVRRNIALSQKRSFAVLERALTAVGKNAKNYACLLRLASASGRGSRDPVFVDGKYNADQSRRVEIKIRVRSREQELKSYLNRVDRETQVRQ